MLLIEKFTQLTLGVANHCYVLSRGQNQFNGLPHQLERDQLISDRGKLGAPDLILPISATPLQHQYQPGLCLY